MPLPRAPAGAWRPERDALPVTLQRFSPSEDGLVAAAAQPAEPPPQIVFPPDGARVDLGVAGGMVPQEDLATIAKYIARLGGGDTARLETNGTLRDAMALRDAVKSFFDRASASGSTAPPIS